MNAKRTRPGAGLWVAVSMLALACAFATTAFAQEATPDAHSPALASPLTRAEVLADVQLWRESGLEALERSEDVDVTSARYRDAVRKYEALRSSVHYGEVMRRIARRLGESLVVGPARC